MQIVRVEDRLSHFGVYSSGIHDEYNWEHDAHSGHPAPYDDSGISAWWNVTNNKSEYRFGFKNMEQLNDWFSAEEQKILIDEDFVIGIYEVPDEFCMISKHQVVFKYDESTRISEVML